jgi:hypothetical protein
VLPFHSDSPDRLYTCNCTGVSFLELLLLAISFQLIGYHEIGSSDCQRGKDEYKNEDSQANEYNRIDSKLFFGSKPFPSFQHVCSIVLSKNNINLNRIV